MSVIAKGLQPESANVLRRFARCADGSGEDAVIEKFECRSRAWNVSISLAESKDRLQKI
ncbi:MAG: hypothetical protein OXH09_16820 [Gammaproteobacteria bacterium]|nr:hypothetical protein [Gammaproteobacteria bacterium]